VNANALAETEFAAVMISCRERDQMRQQTIECLSGTDWPSPPEVFLDEPRHGTPQQRQERNAFVALRHAVALDRRFILFLEDDLEFNRHLWHNIVEWPPLRYVSLASLYNPDIRSLRQKPGGHFFEADPHAVYGSQAFVLSRACARYILGHWHEIEGMQDIKMSRIAAAMGVPLYYYRPSLVQHVGTRSTFGGPYHQAADYEPEFELSTRDTVNIEVDAMAAISNVYDRAFFEMHDPWRAEYDAMGHILAGLLEFSSVLDLGCGNGFLIARFKQLGKHVRGIDGSTCALVSAPVEVREFISVADLTTPFRDERYDLVVCAEVGEHLDEQFADVLVTTICLHSNGLVFFTAAIPGQGGYNHVNEQPPEYWLAKFATRGFALDTEMTNRCRAELTPVLNTTWWFARNAMILRSTT
jgi:SAM-dependent methyltransferase